ncbi:MAG: DUF4167 domain-containing protein [Methylobacteriaceae bacterium]|nr:DUF4167 domain-containing protein [Methylobacteriaceae bacterium]
MRPGQNKRMRGRNPGRKGPNPLTRSYESNGPDVKIRGTAQHVAEKYLQLARDAQSSGDPVMAESYLQHAEHYFRIIAAAHQAQQQAQMGGAPRPPGEAGDDDIEDDGDLGLSDRFASVAERLPPQPVYQAQNFQPQGNFGGGQPQPYGDRPRFNNNNDRQDRQNFGDRQNYNGGERWRNDRNDRQPQDRSYGDRPYQDRNNERQNYQGQPYQDRGNRNDQRRFRGDRPERSEGQNEGRGPSDREPGELPAFITAPGPRPAFPEAEQNSQSETPRDFPGEGGNFHLRSRRRRRGGPRDEGSQNDVPDSDEVPAGE